MKLIIKTLDGRNHAFTVEDDTTVCRLKSKIQQEMQIEPQFQRLIFCGRVLQDEKKLSEYNVQGKVVHLVQRAPPSPDSRETAPNLAPHTQTSATAHAHTPFLTDYDDNAAQQRIRRLMAIASGSEERHNTTSPTSGRLDVIRRMIGDIRNGIAKLRSFNEFQTAGGSRDENMDTDSSFPPSAEAEPDDMPDAQEPSRFPFSRRRSSRGFRQRPPRSLDLAQLMQELETLNLQFTPFRSNYMQLLQESTHRQQSSESRQRSQRNIELVSDVIHSFAHAYHAISDFKLQIQSDQRYPRLSSEPAVSRHAIPMQAQINVFQPNRRTQPSTATATNASPSDPNTSQDREPLSGLTPGVNPAQPTVRNWNYHGEPHPITYQVEIETRVPVTIAVDNQNMSGQTHTVTGQTAAAAQPRFAGQATATTTQPGQTPPAGTQPGQTPSAGTQPGQGSQTANSPSLSEFRTQVLRGVGEVEVLGTADVGTGTTHADTGVIYGPFDEIVRSPTAGLLQNIVSSVLRQGFMTEEDNVPNFLALGPNINITHSRNTTPASSTQTNASGSANGREERPQISIRRTPLTGRSSTIEQFSFVYDPFLNCDHPQARRRIQRRRNATLSSSDAPSREMRTQQQMTLDRARFERAAAAQRAERLGERAGRFHQGHMTTLMMLLNVPAQPTETWMNAIMVTIARELFQTDFLSGLTGDSTGRPNFRPIQHMLRAYVAHVLERSCCYEGSGQYEPAADYLVQQNTEFIGWMATITSIRSGVDVLRSMRRLARDRVPVVVSAVLADNQADSARAITRFYLDLCALISHFCIDGVDGLLNIYVMYIEEAIREFDRPVADMLMALSMDNLSVAINSETFNVDSVLPFLVEEMPAAESGFNLSDSHNPSDPGYLATEVNSTTPGATYVILSSDSSGDVQEIATESPVWSIPDSPQPGAPEPPGPGPEPEEGQVVQSPASPRPDPPELQPHTPDTPAPSSPSRSTSTVTQPQNETATSQQGNHSTDTDGEVQRGSRPAAPYSDAYLAGMPSRKRRCLHQLRPNVTLDGLLNESVTDVCEQPQPAEAAEPVNGAGTIREAFREQIRTMTRDRATSDTDYNGDQHASVMRFLNPKRTPPNNPEETDKQT